MGPASVSASRSSGAAGVADDPAQKRRGAQHSNLALDRLPMLGRSSELSNLHHMLQRVAKGAGEAAVVEGEAGIGKSRLLAELVACARELGFDVYQGAAQELERDRPFGSIADAFDLERASSDRARAQLAELLFGPPGSQPEGLGGSVPGEPSELRFRVVEGMLDLVRRAAATGPVALFFDDLHWADPSTVLALHRVARELGDLPVALVCTSRPAPRSEQVESFVNALRARGSPLVRLSPLDEELATALVIDALGAVPGPNLRRMVMGAAGNPLFILELLSALIQEDAIAFSGGQADIAIPSLPASLRDAVLTQLRALPAEALDVLRAASVLGSSFRLETVSALVNKADVELVPVLERARTAGLIAEAGSLLAFRHDIVREAVYQEMSAAARKALHAAAGRHLADIGAPANQVARHLALGASPGDTQTIEWLRVAAREAAPLAPAIAAELLERAVELCNPDDPDRDPILQELLAALLWAGRLGHAEQVARDLLTRHAEGAMRRDVELRLAQVLMLQSRWAEAAGHFSVLAAANDTDHGQRARLLAEESFARVFSLDLDAALASATEAIALGEEAGDDLPVTLGLQASAMVAQLRGSLHEAVELGERAVSIAERSPSDESRRRQPHLMLGFLLMNVDRLGNAERVLDAGRRQGERSGTVWHLPVYHWLVGVKHFHSGDWAEASRRLDTALVVAEEIETSWDLLNLYGTLAIMALRRGHFSAARDFLARAERDETRRRPPLDVAWLVSARALAREADGDVEAGFSILMEHWDELEAGGVLGGNRVLGAEVVRIALAVGDESRARAVTRSLEKLARKAATSSARASALHARGLLERQPKRLTSAADSYEEAGRPLLRALALEHAGIAARDRSRTADASALLGGAADIYERLGASYDLARADAALRELGVRRPRRSRSERPERGWESLTEAQRKVVQLAAEGLTNPEIGRRLFVSPRTVATHLKHAFAKLGVSSRVELATLVARRDER